MENMTDEEKYKSVRNDLIQRTNERKIKWKHLTGKKYQFIDGELTFIVDNNNLSVRIGTLNDILIEESETITEFCKVLINQHIEIIEQKKQENRALSANILFGKYFKKQI